MKFKRRKPAEPHIPFIALADIAWQIIIFFLIGSTFVQNDSLNLDLPSASSQAQAQQSGETITVQASQGSLALNGQPIEMGQLLPKLQSMLAGKTTEQDRLVVLMGGDDMTFQRNVDIMYAIQKAGGILVISE